MWLLLSCISAKSTDSAKLIQEPSGEQDYDGDGFLDAQSEENPELVDCDDHNSYITPQTHRYIPQTTFSRGWPHSQDTVPVQDISLDAYCIGVYEVTNTDFVHFMNTQKEIGYPNQTQEGLPLFDFEDDDDPYPERIIDAEDYHVQVGYENHPVVEVYRWSAIAYCSSLSMRLPTEAEWELAARSTQGWIYPWGDEDPSCALANYWPQGEQTPCIDDTMPVGSYLPGANGLYDMAGNVSEWVSDWYRIDGYDSAITTNPTGPESGWAQDQMNPEGFEAATARGGSLGSGSGSLRGFHRVPEPLDATSNGLGFRCAFSYPLVGVQ